MQHLEDLDQSFLAEKTRIFDPNVVVEDGKYDDKSILDFHMAEDMGFSICAQLVHAVNKRAPTR